MTDRHETALKFLAARIAADGVVSEEEAIALRQKVFPDGVVSRDEAEALLRLNDRVRGEGAGWSAVFVEALTDHLLGADVGETHLSDDAANWLQRAVLADGVLKRDTEVALLVKVLERAASTPDGFHGFVRDRMFQLLTAPPPANLGEADVALIRNVLFAQGGDGSIAVSREEAEWLFAIDTATDGGDHHPSWRTLFVQAILNHLLAAAAPALLSRATALHRIEIAGRAPKTLQGRVAAFFEKLGHTSPERAMTRYWEGRVAAFAEAERLTVSEIAWVTARARADARVTANEKAVLEEIRRIEAEQAAAMAHGAPGPAR